MNCNTLTLCFASVFLFALATNELAGPFNILVGTARLAYFFRFSLAQHSTAHGSNAVRDRNLRKQGYFVPCA